MDKEDVHMDQELELEVGMVEEGCQGTNMGSDTGKEKMTHNYPSNRTQILTLDNIKETTQILIFNTKGSQKIWKWIYSNKNHVNWI